MKSLATEEIAAAADALGMRHGKTIELETEDEIAVLMDYAIYNLFREGSNAVDRMLAENPPPEGSPEKRLLLSQQKSHYTIFQVESRIPGFGVEGVEGSAQTPVMLVDVGFSMTARPGAAMATRIHSPGEGWWMTTGAALPMTQEAESRIFHELDGHLRRFHSQPSEQDRTTIIIRACVAAGASQQIAYASFGKGKTIIPQRGATPIGGGPKIGRNDPCPCGSGKKYKKCCGA